MQLMDKTAIVTGASSGIGRSIAFAREGAAVTVNYARDAEGAASTVKEIEDGGGRAVAVRADVSKPEDVKALVERTVKELGGLDVMVTNAGVEHKMPFLETPLEVWEESSPSTSRAPGWDVRRRPVRWQGKTLLDASSTSRRYTRTCRCRPTPLTLLPRAACAC
jgi:NAD(P)-dependent dehydrogenase (short-subunit alcohol dehydrogenase family)